MDLKRNDECKAKIIVRKRHFKRKLMYTEVKFTVS